LIKRRASAIRINYDLHRAGGLWAWPLLFVLAWSSVMFNLRDAVYEPVTGALFDYESGMDSYASMMRLRHANPTPRLDWIAAQAAGARLMTQEAARRGLKVLRPYGMAYIESLGVYTYGVVSDADIQHHAWSTSLWLDGDSGTLVQMDVPSGEHAGNTIETWLRALHFRGSLGFLALSGHSVRSGSRDCDGLNDRNLHMDQKTAGSAACAAASGRGH
jgi:uncharacterized iron-regulated membrane protein